MLRLLLLIASLATLIVLPFNQVTGQNLLEGYTYRVVVRDSATSDPVPYPALRALNFEKGFVGNERGILEFNWPEPTLLVEFSAVGYAKTNYLLAADRKTRTLRPELDNDLPTIVISSDNYFSEYYKIGYNFANALTMYTINGRTQENAYRRDKYQDALFLRDYMYVNKAEHYYFGGTDQLYFFDFSSWRLRTFDWNGKKKEVTLLPVKIGRKKVPDRVIYDAKKSRFYTYLNTREGFMLYEIDSESGRFAAVSQLPLREIRDLLVHNGRVYAIGKGDLDVQSNWRALYSVSL